MNNYCIVFLLYIITHHPKMNVAFLWLFLCYLHFSSLFTIGDMECCGGELSDSGSSGYWSWDHGSVSPAPSPSVNEMDRSSGQLTDEGLHMELDQAACEEPEARRCKVRMRKLSDCWTWGGIDSVLSWCCKNTCESLFVFLSHSQSLSRGAYRCLWPGCGKVLTSRFGMKRHIRILHLGWVCPCIPNSWNNWDGTESFCIFNPKKPSVLYLICNYHSIWAMKANMVLNK